MPSTSDQHFFWEIHSGLPRQGPGDNQSTRKAFAALPKLPDEPFILDVACGPGMQTIELANLCKADIVAVDLRQEFLDELDRRAEVAKVSDRVTTVNASMLELPFDEDSFDLIWSEGAIYIIGFEDGLTAWKPLLKKGGCVAVTNVSYLKDDVPDQVRNFWHAAYPEITTIDNFLKTVERCGYQLLDHFTLPSSAWMDDYYTPMEKQLQSLRAKYSGNSDAIKAIDQGQHEIDMYRKYSDCYGYVFYVMQAT
ncbi:class I SAM-dependent methyltransferase [soil metagenome]